MFGNDKVFKNVMIAHYSVQALSTPAIKSKYQNDISLIIEDLDLAEVMEEAIEPYVNDFVDMDDDTYEDMIADVEDFIQAAVDDMNEELEDTPFSLYYDSFCIVNLENISHKTDYSIKDDFLHTINKDINNIIQYEPEGINLSIHVFFICIFIKGIPMCIIQPKNYKG